jgi:hypothetical protein
MKKLITVIVLGIVVFGFASQHAPVNAQGMMGRFASPSPSNTSISSTAKDEADGKAVYELLQSKEKSCKDLTDEDFDVLGDYYMGQRLGNTATHDSMNSMMKNMMGEEGEMQMHISLGKRLNRDIIIRFNVVSGLEDFSNQTILCFHISQPSGMTPIQRFDCDIKIHNFFLIKQPSCYLASMNSSFLSMSLPTT